MSNLKTAANPAQSPQTGGATPETTEYVCTNPDYVCDINCYKCPYYVPESETVSMEPDIWDSEFAECERLLNVCESTLEASIARIEAMATRGI